MEQTVQTTTQPAIPFAMIVVFIFAAFMWFLYQDQNHRLQKVNAQRKPTVGCLVTLGVITLIKILISPYFKGYEVDMNTYTAWMERAAGGLNGFYADGYFCDYPPLYIMMTGFFGWVKNLLGGGEYLTKLFVKMPGMIAEGLIGYEILRAYSKRYPVQKQLPMTLLLAIFPSFLITGTYWGQTDGIFCYLMLLTFRFLLEEKLTLSALMFTLSALTKPQSFLFAPLVAVMFIKSDSLIFIPRLRDKFSKALKVFWNTFLTFVFAVAIMSISMMPFRNGVPDILFLIKKYTETFSSYPYASLNTFNLFGLLNGNMRNLTEPFLFLTFEKWGTILMAVCVLGGILAVIFNKDKKNLFLIFGTYLFAIVMLGSKMHERYWYFVPLLMLLAFVFTGKKKYFGISCLLSLTYFLNLDYALWYLGGSRNAQLQEFYNMIFVVATIINLAVLWYLVWDVYTGIRASCSQNSKDSKKALE